MRKEPNTDTITPSSLEEAYFILDNMQLECIDLQNRLIEIEQKLIASAPSYSVYKNTLKSQIDTHRSNLNTLQLAIQETRTGDESLEDVTSKINDYFKIILNENTSLDNISKEFSENIPLYNPQKKIYLAPADEIFDHDTFSQKRRLIIDEIIQSYGKMSGDIFNKIRFETKNIIKLYQEALPIWEQIFNIYHHKFPINPITKYRLSEYLTYAEELLDNTRNNEFMFFDFNLIFDTLERASLLLTDLVNISHQISHETAAWKKSHPNHNDEVVFSESVVGAIKKLDTAHNPTLAIETCKLALDEKKMRKTYEKLERRFEDSKLNAQKPIARRRFSTRASFINSIRRYQRRKGADIKKLNAEIAMLHSDYSELITKIAALQELNASETTLFLELRQKIDKFFLEYTQTESQENNAIQALTNLYKAVDEFKKTTRVSLRAKIPHVRVLRSQISEKFKAAVASLKTAKNDLISLHESYDAAQELSKPPAETPQPLKPIESSESSNTYDTLYQKIKFTVDKINNHIHALNTSAINLLAEFSSLTPLHVSFDESDKESYKALRSSITQFESTYDYTGKDEKSPLKPLVDFRNALISLMANQNLTLEEKIAAYTNLFSQLHESAAISIQAVLDAQQNLTRIHELYERAMMPKKPKNENPAQATTTPPAEISSNITGKSYYDDFADEKVREKIVTASTVTFRRSDFAPEILSDSSKPSENTKPNRANKPEIESPLIEEDKLFIFESPETSQISSSHNAAPIVDEDTVINRTCFKYRQKVEEKAAEFNVIRETKPSTSDNKSRNIVWRTDGETHLNLEAQHDVLAKRASEFEKAEHQALLKEIDELKNDSTQAPASRLAQLEGLLKNSNPYRVQLAVPEKSKEDENKSPDAYKKNSYTKDALQRVLTENIKCNFDGNTELSNDELFALKAHVKYYHTVEFKGVTFTNPANAKQASTSVFSSGQTLVTHVQPDRKPN